LLLQVIKDKVVTLAKLIEAVIQTEIILQRVIDKNQWYLVALKEILPLQVIKDKVVTLVKLIEAVIQTEVILQRVTDKNQWYLIPEVGLLIIKRQQIQEKVTQDLVEGYKIKKINRN